MNKREELLMLMAVVEGPFRRWLEASLEERFMALLYQLEGADPNEPVATARLQGKLAELREVRAMPHQRIAELKREIV